MFEGIKQGIKHFFRKESKTGRSVMMRGGQASWSQRNTKAFAEEGYQKNVIVYQAVNKIANATAAIPWILYKGKNEIDQHPMLELLARPNPMQSGAEFTRAMVGFYMIAGNSYIERIMANNTPRELYPIRPDRMKIKPGNGMPLAYVFQVASETPVIWEVDPTDGMSDIRHLKSFNPLDDWYGMSPFMAGAYAVDQHNEAMTWMQALLQNSAMPSGALEMDAQQTIGDDEFQRLKAEIDEQYAGAKNAGRPMLLEGGLKWTQMGLSPDDMNVIETKYSSARDISLAAGVPPLLLNIPGDSTYSNYQEARLAFYEETVIPLAHMIRDEMNVWLAPAFGDNLRLDLDLDKVPAIAEKRRELWTMADQSNDLTINERRAMKGYEPVPGGESVMLPANLLPIDFADNVPALPTPNDQQVEPQADPVETDSADPARSLNGAQVDALMRIVQAVALRDLPRDTGVAIISASFPLDRDQADKIIGEVGRSFFLEGDQVELSARMMAEIKALAYGETTTKSE